MLSESAQTVTRQKEGRSYYVKFQESWLIHLKWLVYSPSAKGGYCKYCVLLQITVQEQNQVSLLQPLLQTFGKQPERMVF